MPLPPVEGEEAFDDPREDEVDDLRCLWCKLHMEDADDDLRYHELGTREVLCDNCLGDLRSFKRGVDVQLVVTTEFDELEPGLKKQISAAMWNAGEEVLQEHGGGFDSLSSFSSNAAGREEEEEPSVERKADLTPADMDPDDDEGPGPVEWVQGHPDSIANVGEFIEEFDEETLIDLTPEPLQYSVSEDSIYPADDEPEFETDGGQAELLRVRVGQARVTLDPDEDVFSLFARLRGDSPSKSLGPHSDYSALYRDEDVTKGPEGVRYPDPEDHVPADLSTVEDGDDLHLFRMRNKHRPIYTEE